MNCTTVPSALNIEKRSMKEVAARSYLRVSGRIGHPVGFSPKMKLAVLERILYLE